MLSLLAVAFADAPDDATVQVLASKALEKDVPAKYLCIKRPDLIEGISGDPTPVGIKIKNKGCTLKGVIVDGKWFGPDEALIAAVPTWAGLAADERGTLAIPWVRDVLLAFQQTTEAPTRDGKTVLTGVVYRIAKPQHATQVRASFTFSNAGTVHRKQTDEASFKTSMAVKMNAVKGVDQGQATAGLSSVGKLLQECVRRAWAADLTSQGRSRMGWDILDGKATNVTARGWGPTSLVRCYSGAIRRIEFPADGHVDATIAITRTPSE